VFIPDADRTDATLWQAERGYQFRLANGYLSPEVPDGIRDREAAYDVLYNVVPAGGGIRLVRLARELDATMILLDAEHTDKWPPVLADAGLQPVEKGDLWLYPLRPALPSCQ
jgi:hypothetical protein